MRRLALFALIAAALAAPVRADQALLVWNDPAQMAIRLVRFDTSEPGRALALSDLAPLKANSATMTGISSDGRAIGLCHQTQDGNEAPTSLSGFDAKGRLKWEVFPGDLYAALQENLAPDFGLTSGPDRLTFSCVGAGATGKPGGLAFDIGLTIAVFGAGATADVTMRLHLNGKNGRLLAVSGLGSGEPSLGLGANPVGPLHRDTLTGKTFYVMTDGGFVLPKGGKGRALWSSEAIRWRGDPVGEGTDFAWFVPPAPPM
jgi:hypothetical protein